MSLEAAVERLRDENARRAVRHKPKPLSVAGSGGANASEEY